ncbi:DeoR/GlpR transcriptional regulator [Roseibacillus persicicus]|uniref:DeoR-like transcriptional repressor C-terminal sensor domain-containing protein n=1 Tax=Roseibacillus persicicus TaxID=454148 RepID=A0A918WPD1_9BACT|nr:DeoR/GlpR transcriptional regulator [Roseibacillus persicicus]GHC65237.1 hypothetical protein GCM10007100_36210 [Roseibacillus persicicus]
MSKPKDRRAYILREIDQKGFVKHGDLRQKFGESLGVNSIQADVEHLVDYGLNIVSENGMIFRENAHVPQTLRVRKNKKQEEKAQIARVVASMLLGPEQSSLNEGANTKRFYSREELMHEEIGACSVEKELSKLWDKNVRVLGTDSGTTNEAVCRLVSRAKIPCSTLSRLRFFTNCMTHFEVLGGLRYPFEVFVVGGQIRNLSDSVTGELAIKCMNAWDLKLDVAVVAATNLILGSTAAYTCYGVEEAMVKSHFLACADFKIVTADSSKITRDFSLGASPFANLDSVDCLVTDAGIHKEERAGLKEELLSAGVNIISGIEDSGSI